MLTRGDAATDILCSRCSNTEMAQLAGLHRFEHVDFEPVRISDGDGRAHEFHFRVHLFGLGVSISAFELVRGRACGYRFRVIGEPEGDLLALLGRLIEKIRRGLSVKHLTRGAFGLQIAEHQVVRGRIGWDPEHNGELPLLTIDGRDIAWDELGRMLMTFEGWQFKLEIRDPSEEV